MYHLSGVKPVDARSAAKAADREREERLHSTRLLNIPKIRRRNVFELQSTGLSDLTEVEIDLLSTFEEEHSRRGHFSRIFPTPETKEKYGHYFPALRYNNALYDIWLQAPNSEKGRVLSFR